MRSDRSRRILLMAPLIAAMAGRSSAQNFPFTSGPIPLCDTSTFTTQVNGLGTLTPPGWDPWSPSWWINTLTINITSDHPQTLQITLTSPEGTDLLLSAFNGAGGQNYINTVFNYDWYASITTGTAPFTGNFTAQGGSFGAFDYENPNGTWTITVIDTACTNINGGGGGGPWTPGWFDGSGGGGGFAIGFDPGFPPCWGGIGPGSAFLCPGGSVDILSYYSGSGYSITVTAPDWTPVADPTNVTTPGIYWVDALDPWDGCWYTANFEVTPTSGSSLGPDQSITQCASAGPVDLTALFSIGSATPIWSQDGASITTAQAMAANTTGIYQLITDNGGCGDTVLVDLTISAGPSLGPDQSVIICAGGTLDLTALFSTAGLTTAWEYGGGPFVTPNSADQAGVYTLVATDAGGCTDQADVTLSVGAFTPLGADLALDLCDNSTLDLTTLYSTTGLVTAWSLAGSPVPDPSMVNIGGVYELIATGGSGCGDTALVSVNLVGSPALGADATAGACEGNTVDLTALFATGALNSIWTLSGTPVPDPGAVDSGGVYTLVAIDGAGCSDTALANVTITPYPVLGPDQTLTGCEGSITNLTTLYATGADATAWTVLGVPVTDPENVATSGVFTLTTTNTAGCSSTAMVTLALDPSPALGADQSASTCAGTPFDLTPLYDLTGLSGAWTLNGTPVSDPSAVDITGDYRLVATNAAGCTDTAVVSLILNPAPMLGPDISFSLCPWQSVDLSAVFPTTGYSVTYTLDDLPVDTPTAVSEPGLYLVHVTDVNGCTDEATASISSIACLCEGDFTAEVRCMQEPARFTLLADSVILAAHWDFGGATTASEDIDPEVRFTQEGDVRVTLEATLSCGVVTVERMIHVDDCSDSCSVWIPSAFTPDQDGRNELWGWSGACVPDEFSMRVFNRWGELVYATGDPRKPWDGSYGGSPAPPGIYAYQVGYRLPYQKRKEVSGAVTLLR